MVALIAAMMMCLTAEAKTEDVGGRVIDAQGEPLPFVSVALVPERQSVSECRKYAIHHIIVQNIPNVWPYL